MFHHVSPGLAAWRSAVADWRWPIGTAVRVPRGADKGGSARIGMCLVFKTSDFTIQNLDFSVFSRHVRTTRVIYKEQLGFYH